MLYIYDKSKDRLTTSEEMNFKSHGIMERKHIEQWIVENPQIRGRIYLLSQPNTINLTKHGNAWIYFAWVKR